MYIDEPVPPGAVDRALWIPFTSGDPDNPNLILAKSNWIEVYSLVKPDPDAHDRSPKLTFVTKHKLYGNITYIHPIQINDRSRYSLVVAFEQPHIVILSFDKASHSLFTVSAINFESSRVHPVLTFSVPTQTGDGTLGIPLAVDPQSRCLTIKPGPAKSMLLVPQVNGEFHPAIPLDLKDLGIINIKDSVFLAGYHNPTLMLLHENIPGTIGRLAHRNHTCIVSVISLKITADSVQSFMVWTVQGLPVGCHTLIPLHDETGGAMILGNNTVFYLNQTVKYGIALNSYSPISHMTHQQFRMTTSKMKPFFGWGAVASWISPSKLLLTANNGDLYLFTLKSDGKVLRKIKGKRVGTGIPPSCIAAHPTQPDNNPIVFLGSRVTNSILYYYSEDSFQEADSLFSLAPGRDLVICPTPINHSYKLQQDSRLKTFYLPQGSRGSSKNTQSQTRSRTKRNREDSERDMNTKTNLLDSQSTLQTPLGDISLDNLTDVSGFSNFCIPTGIGKSGKLTFCSSHIQPTFLFENNISSAHRCWTISIDPVDLSSPSLVAGDSSTGSSFIFFSRQFFPFESDDSGSTSDLSRPSYQPDPSQTSRVLGVVNGELALYPATAFDTSLYTLCVAKYYDSIIRVTPKSIIVYSIRLKNDKPQFKVSKTFDLAVEIKSAQISVYNNQLFITGLAIDNSLYFYKIYGSVQTTMSNGANQNLSTNANKQRLLKKVNSTLVLPQVSTFHLDKNTLSVVSLTSSNATSNSVIYILSITLSGSILLKSSIILGQLGLTLDIRDWVHHPSSSISQDSSSSVVVTGVEEEEEEKPNKHKGKTKTKATKTKSTKSKKTQDSTLSSIRESIESSKIRPGQTFLPEAVPVAVFYGQLSPTSPVFLFLVLRSGNLLLYRKSFDGRHFHKISTPFTTVSVVQTTKKQLSTLEFFNYQSKFPEFQYLPKIDHNHDYPALLVTGSRPLWIVEPKPGLVKVFPQATFPVSKTSGFTPNVILSSDQIAPDQKSTVFEQAISLTCQTISSWTDIPLSATKRGILQLFGDGTLKVSTLDSGLRLDGEFPCIDYHIGQTPHNVLYHPEHKIYTVIISKLVPEPAREDPEPEALLPDGRPDFAAALPHDPEPNGVPIRKVEKYSLWSLVLNPDYKPFKSSVHITGTGADIGVDMPGNDDENENDEHPPDGTDTVKHTEAETKHIVSKTTARFRIVSKFEFDMMEKPTHMTAGYVTLHTTTSDVPELFQDDNHVYEKKYSLLISASYVYGEDIEAKGRVLVFDLLKPKSATIGTQKYLGGCEHVATKVLKKDPATSVNILNRFIIVATGMRIVLYRYMKEAKQLTEAYFFDAQYHITQMDVHNDLVLACDILDGVYLLYWIESTTCLTAVARSDPPPGPRLACTAASFLPVFRGSPDLFCLVADINNNLHFFAFDPSSSVQRFVTTPRYLWLCRKISFHIGGQIRRIIKAPSRPRHYTGQYAASLISILAGDTWYSSPLTRKSTNKMTYPPKPPQLHLDQFSDNIDDNLAFASTPNMFLADTQAESSWFVTSTGSLGFCLPLSSVGEVYMDTDTDSGDSEEEENILLEEEEAQEEGSSNNIKKSKQQDTSSEPRLNGNSGNSGSKSSKSMKQKSKNYQVLNIKKTKTITFRDRPSLLLGTANELEALRSIQNILYSCLQTTGGLNPKGFRGYRKWNDHPRHNDFDRAIIDGYYVSSFLKLSLGDQREIVNEWIIKESETSNINIKRDVILGYLRFLMAIFYRVDMAAKIY